MNLAAPLIAAAEDETWKIDNVDLRLLAVVLTLWLILILGSGFLILRASQSPPPMALVMVLSEVTLVCIAAFVISRDQVILQLASVGLGALAAAVATTWGAVSKRYEQEADELKKKVGELEKKVEPDDPPVENNHDDNGKEGTA